jgi:hypothetical protein
MRTAWRQLGGSSTPLLSKLIQQVLSKLIQQAPGIRHATAYMAERLSRPQQIENYRAMTEILGWDRRRTYKALITGLEELKQFTDPDSIQNFDRVLTAIRNLADDFEYCLPNTSQYFNGLWRRSHKAMSFADYVRRISSNNPPDVRRIG